MRQIILNDSELSAVSVLDIPEHATIGDARRILSGARALAHVRGFTVVLVGAWPAWHRWGCQS